MQTNSPVLWSNAEVVKTGCSRCSYKSAVICSCLVFKVPLAILEEGSTKASFIFNPKRQSHIWEHVYVPKRGKPVCGSKTKTKCQPQKLKQIKATKRSEAAVVEDFLTVSAPEYGHSKDNRRRTGQEGKDEGLWHKPLFLESPPVSSLAVPLLRHISWAFSTWHQLAWQRMGWSHGWVFQCPQLCSSKKLTLLPTVSHG